jgi:hypothetical protein
MDSTQLEDLGRRADAEVSAAPAASTADRDTCELVIGPPKVGKTSVQYELAEADLVAGEWLFAHDPNAQFGGLCARYETLDEWGRKAAEAFRAGKPFPRGASIGDPRSRWVLGEESGEGLIPFVYALGKRLNHVNRVRMPLTLVTDEVSLLGDESGPSYMSRALDQLINNRRHRGVRLRFNLQRPTQLPIGLWDVVTRVYLFACAQPSRVRALEERLHLADGTLEPLLTLQNHRYYTVVPRKGVIA